MAEELLTEIVAAEREIRRRISTLEEELAARIETVRAETTEGLIREETRLDAELAERLEQETRTARKEAEALVAEAHAYAERIGSLEAGQLDGILIRHLHTLWPEERHDRPDEQG